ncbi:MAG TPA: hypothetical protein PKM19_10530, partial [Pseudomonadales bacterium]|nr:hypothetical protein [Pseudomonadales bacterium]
GVEGGHVATPWLFQSVPGFSAGPNWQCSVYLISFMLKSPLPRGAARTRACADLNPVSRHCLLSRRD